jgi:hypothetical protein
MNTLGAPLVIECPECRPENHSSLGEIVTPFLLQKIMRVQGLARHKNGTNIPVPEIIRMALVIGLEGLLETFDSRPVKPPKGGVKKKKSRK